MKLSWKIKSREVENILDLKINQNNAQTPVIPPLMSTRFDHEKWVMM
jgi:hypothetical protein